MLEQYHAGQATGTGQASARPENRAAYRDFSAHFPDREPLTDAINYVQTEFIWSAPFRVQRKLRAR